MNVVLCKEIVNTMPKEGLMSAGLPVKAIEYYMESLCRPFTNLEDLPLLFMITVTYIEIEWMLSHYQNLDILVRSAMEILYSNRGMLWDRYHRDHLFFIILSEFLRLSSEAPIDSISSPLHLWAEIHSFALKLGLGIGVDGLLLLEIRMYDIRFRLSRSDFNNSSIGWKIVTWEHDMAQHQRELKPGSRDMKRLEHMRYRNLSAKIFWHAFQFGLSRNAFYGEILRALIELHTRKLEALLKQPWVQTMSKNPLMHLQVFMYIIPNISFIVRCARDKAICHRLVKVLSALRSWISYHDDLVDYLETATETEHGYHTPLEVVYLGPILPLILTKWQVTRVVDQIATRGATKLLRSKNLPTPLSAFAP